MNRWVFVMILTFIYLASILIFAGILTAIEGTDQMGFGESVQHYTLNSTSIGGFVKQPTTSTGSWFSSITSTILVAFFLLSLFFTYAVFKVNA